MSKSKSIRTNFLEEVYPPLTKEKVNDFLSEYGKPTEFQIAKNSTFSNIPKDLENLLTQVFIKKNIKNLAAIKARFAQYFEYSDFFSKYEILEKNKKSKNIKIDWILKNTSTEEFTWIISTEILDQTELTRIKNSLIGLYKDNEEKNKKQNQMFENLKDIYLICGKIDRKITDESEFLEINSHQIIISYFFEYSDPNRLFEDEDLIIVDELKIRGFNFNSLEDILSLIKKIKGKGNYTVIKENKIGIRKIIWQGFIFPKELLR
jgi:hypothetical protein